MPINLLKIRMKTVGQMERSRHRRIQGFHRLPHLHRTSQIWKRKLQRAMVRWRWSFKITRYDVSEQVQSYHKVLTIWRQKHSGGSATTGQTIRISRCRCRMCYSQRPNGTIDEMLVGFRGRCPFRLNMPSKHNHYGIKIWVSADSETCYLYVYNAQIYLGKEGNLPEVEQASRVVMDLCHSIYQSGHNITTDNFFTSVPLAIELLGKRLTLMGTLRINKPEIPPSF